MLWPLESPAAPHHLHLSSSHPIRPQVVYWAWSDNAWLFEGSSDQPGVGYRDFAGSGIVHITGGAAALVGTWLLGPRLIRKQQDGSFRTVTPNSPELATLGTFILIFG